MYTCCTFPQPGHWCSLTMGHTTSTDTQTHRHSPLRTMRTFFHCVLPTLGVWQKRIFCLSHTKMRSRTNLLMEVCVRFLREAFLQTLASWSRRLSSTERQSDGIVGNTSTADYGGHTQKDARISVHAKTAYSISTCTCIRSYQG